MSVRSAKILVRIAKPTAAAVGTTTLKKESPAAIDYVTTLGIPTPGAVSRPHPTPDPPRRRSSDQRPFACNHILKALFDQSVSDGAAALEPGERARCLLLAEQCCQVASERGDVVDALAHIPSVDWASVVATAGRIVLPTFNGKELGCVLRSVAQVHVGDRNAFADLCAPWLSAGLSPAVLVHNIAALAAVQPASQRPFMRDTLTLISEADAAPGNSGAAHMLSKKAQ